MRRLNEAWTWEPTVHFPVQTTLMIAALVTLLAATATVIIRNLKTATVSPPGIASADRVESRVDTLGEEPSKAYSALAITSESAPRSTCKRYTDIYLRNTSSRAISADVRRLNNVDSETSVSTYTLPGSVTTLPWLPWVGAQRDSELKIGCLFEGSRTYTYTITRAEYN